VAGYPQNDRDDRIGHCSNRLGYDDVAGHSNALRERPHRAECGLDLNVERGRDLADPSVALLQCLPDRGLGCDTKAVHDKLRRRHGHSAADQGGDGAARLIRLRFLEMLRSGYC
jgi:hypothetical protein